MDENRLHSLSFWNKSIVQIRNETNFIEGSEKQIEKWINDKKNKVEKLVLDNYKILMKKYGLTIYGINYYFSCLLSHHKGGTFHHSLPKNLRFNPDKLLNSSDGIFSKKDGFIRVFYIPQSKAPEGFSWEPIHPPRGFHVKWPNIPIMKEDKPLLFKIKDRVKKELGENIFWFNWDNYTYKYEGKIFNFPVVVSSKNIGKAIHRHLGIPDKVPMIKNIMAVPVVQFGNNSHRIFFPGGTEINTLRQANIIRDLYIENEDKEYANRWEKVLKVITTNEELIKHGFAPENIPYPGEKLTEYVQRQYRELLEKAKDVKYVYKEKRKNARERGRKFKDRGFFSEDDELEEKWFEDIEKEFGINQ